MHFPKRKPRDWQLECLDMWRTRRGNDFILVAVTGGGKTDAALLCAKDFLAADPARRRVIVVVPYTNVRKQWRRKAKDNFDIELQTKEFTGHLKSGMDGIGVTYSYISMNALLFRRLCAQFDCMVIFDEIHHAGQKAAWGQGINEGFENASERFSMTGTPFRTAGDPIQWMQPDPDNPGCNKVDFIYDHKRGLREGHLRTVNFYMYDSRATVVDLKKKNLQFRSIDTRDPFLDDRDAERMLGILLRDERFVEGFLVQADQKLTEMRRIRRDAAGIVPCIDTSHAIWVAGILERVTGEKPAIILSDDDAANTTADRFEKSKQRWVVAVRMISEGVDIPRLMVLAYMTTTTAELFFKQIVGRILRWQEADQRLDAYCLLPNVPRLASLATEILEFQNAAIEEEDEEEKKPRKPSEGAGMTGLYGIDADEPEFSYTISGDQEHDHERSDRVRRLSPSYPEIPENRLLALFADYDGLNNGGSGGEQPFEPAGEPTREEREETLRKLIHKRVAALAARTGEPHNTINTRYTKAACRGIFKAQSAMSAEELERKFNLLEEAIRNSPQ